MDVVERFLRAGGELVHGSFRLREGLLQFVRALCRRQFQICDLLVDLIDHPLDCLPALEQSESTLVLTSGFENVTSSKFGETINKSKSLFFALSLKLQVSAFTAPTHLVGIKHDGVGEQVFDIAVQWDSLHCHDGFLF